MPNKQKMIHNISLVKKSLRSALAVAGISLFVSCGLGEKEPNPVEDSLRNVTRQQDDALSDKDSSIESYLRSFNEIQQNLDVIKEKEKMINVNTQDAELQKTQKDKIVEDIQAIYQLMIENKQKLEALNSKLRKSNKKVAELEKLIARLNTQLEEKDGEITELKTKLDQLSVEIANLTMDYKAVQEESEMKTQKINTAFYAFGTSKELKEKGVITKEGGFIGIGKADKLKDNFNKDYFTRIDVTQTTSIPLAAKKAKIVTTHPSSSYKLEGTKDKVEKITITNAEEFWGASKYLVIIVE